MSKVLVPMPSLRWGFLFYYLHPRLAKALPLPFAEGVEQAVF